MLFFSRLGKAVGGNPWISILISLIVCGGCAAGLINFTQEARGDKLWTPEDSTTQKHKLWVDENFPLEVRFSTALLVAGDVLTPAVLKEVKYHHDILTVLSTMFSVILVTGQEKVQKI